MAAPLPQPLRRGVANRARLGDARHSARQLVGTHRGPRLYAHLLRALVFFYGFLVIGLVLLGTSYPEKTWFLTIKLIGNFQVKCSLQSIQWEELLLVGMNSFVFIPIQNSENTLSMWRIMHHFEHFADSLPQGRKTTPAGRVGHSHSCPQFYLLWPRNEQDWTTWNKTLATRAREACGKRTLAVECWTCGKVPGIV